MNGNEIESIDIAVILVLHMSLYEMFHIQSNFIPSYFILSLNDHPFHSPHCCLSEQTIH